jgi:hypothetical protein
MALPGASNTKRPPVFRFRKSGRDAVATRSGQPITWHEPGRSGVSEVVDSGGQLSVADGQQVASLTAKPIMKEPTWNLRLGFAEGAGDV